MIPAHALFLFWFFIPQPLPPVVEVMPQRVDLIIRGECLREPIRAEDCDTFTLQCKRIDVNFRADCVEVHVVKGK